MKLYATVFLMIIMLLMVMFVFIHVYGIGWTSTEVVSTESTRDSREPSLAVGSNGTVHIAWYDLTDYGGSGTDRDIFYKRFVPGSGWTTTEVVSTESTELSGFPSLCVGSDGTVHIAWEDETDYGGADTDRDIFYKKYESGTGWTTTEVVSTESTDSSKDISLGVSQDGTVHIAWSDWTNWTDWTDYAGMGTDGIDDDIFYKRFVPGTGWTSTEVVSIESSWYSRYPSLGVGSDGVVHIAWADWGIHTDDSGTDWDIFYKRLELGTGWTSTEVVSTESTELSEAPSLGVGLDGTVHIAWDDVTDYGGSGSDFDVFYKKKVLGSDWTETEVVSTESTDDIYTPSLAVGSDGAVHIAWTNPAIWGPSNEDDIFYRRYLPGAGWTSTEVVTTEGTYRSDNPSLGVGSDGTVHIAWDDWLEYGGSGPDRDIFYKRFELDAEAPVTVDDYDGAWHNADFMITLSATDDSSGVAETYYKINDGPTRSVGSDGQPIITTEGANNKLEYWSVDNADNEELPHKVLTGIKLDKTPPVIGEPSQQPSGDVQPDEPVTVTVSIMDSTSDIYHAALSYTNNDGAFWFDVQLNYNSASGKYQAIIPEQTEDTLVKYKITAYDNAGNSATKDNAGQYYVYTVIPEYSSLILISALIIATIAITVYGNKSSKKQKS